MAGNPFYASTLGRQVGGSLGDLFRADPQSEAAIAARMAQSRLYDSQAGEVEARVAANPRAADALARGDMQEYYRHVVTGGSAPMVNAAPGLVLGYTAAGNPTTDRLSNAFVGAGHSEAGSPRGFATSQATTRRGQDINSGDDRYRTDQTRAGALEREQLQETGRNNRTAVELNNNTDFVVGPNHPLAGQATDGRITGPRVETGTAARPARIANVPASITRRFTDFFGGEVTLRDGNNYHFAPPAQRHLAARASVLWQSGPEGVRGNDAAAMEEALAEFEATKPPRTDATWWWPSNRTLGMPTAPGAQTPTAQDAAPQPAAQAVPPPAQREPGKVYQLPRGLFIWTGTGWRPAS